jgi:hypothetical protein
VRIGSVDVPEALLTAQSRGQLAIFAGAGVSMPPPSDLPNLVAMASVAAEGSGLSLEEGEPVDRFLGRLMESGVQVHQKVAEAVSNPSSRPTTLHRDLLKLFLARERVRLVTTNFDTHFTTAAREIFGDEMETYYAPALPLGHDFNGLVYLHGSVGKDPGQVVLTDGDFGRAYLTEGWARRFLQNLLASYTVLFVGYSHSDPVMNYLSRGLPPEVRDLARRRSVRRFALTPEGGRRHWEFLGVTPIEYPVQEGDGRHTALSESVAEWVRLLKEGGLDHEARIQAIVGNEPPASGQGADDYLEAALRETDAARAFFRSARSPAWLLWAEERGLLDPLFDAGDDANPVAAEMAGWFAGAFLCRHPWTALAVARREGRSVGPALWRAVVDRICSPADEAPSREVRALWLELLLRSSLAGGEVELLSRLAGQNGACGGGALVLLAFQHLSAPRLDVASPAGDAAAGGEGLPAPEPRIVLVGDVAALREGWSRLFRPHLPELAEQLRPILEGHLARARLLAEAIGGDEGAQGEGVRFLVEVAREVSSFTEGLATEAPGAPGGTREG